MSDPYVGFGFPRLFLRQDDVTLVLPIYEDMKSAEGLVKLGNYLDVKLLVATGKVLPSRVWTVAAG
jgi:hypothetical protein